MKTLMQIILFPIIAFVLFGGTMFIIEEKNYIIGSSLFLLGWMLIRLFQIISKKKKNKNKVTPHFESKMGDINSSVKPSIKKKNNPFLEDIPGDYYYDDDSLEFEEKYDYEKKGADPDGDYIPLYDIIKRYPVTHGNNQYLVSYKNKSNTIRTIEVFLSSVRVWPDSKTTANFFDIEKDKYYEVEIKRITEIEWNEKTIYNSNDIFSHFQRYIN